MHECVCEVMTRWSGVKFGEPQGGLIVGKRLIIKGELLVKMMLYEA